MLQGEKITDAIKIYDMWEDAGHRKKEEADNFSC